MSLFFLVACETGAVPFDGAKTPGTDAPSAVDLDAVDDFGAVGDAIWLQVDEDGELTESLQLSTVPDLCAHYQDYYAAYAAYLANVYEVDPYDWCAEMRPYFVDLATAGEALHAVDSRYLALAAPPEGFAAGESTVNADGVVGSMYYVTADYWGEMVSRYDTAGIPDDNCGMYAEDYDAEEVWEVRDGTLRLDTLTPGVGAEGGIDGALATETGAAAGTVEARFQAGWCAITL